MKDNAIKLLVLVFTLSVLAFNEARSATFVERIMGVLQNRKSLSNTILPFVDRINSQGGNLLDHVFDGKFLVPNEHYIELSIPYLVNSSSGIYLTVGTERGFMGAALKENCTGLILVDKNPSVVLFNRINILLLKISKPNSRIDYLNLRLASRHADWLTRLSESEGLSSEEKSFLSRSEIFNWWRYVLDSRQFNVYHTGGGGIYKTSYLYDDHQFNRIQKLAQLDNIISFIFDFNSSEQFKMLVGLLAKNHLKIGVLDLSNAWWKSFLNWDRLKDNLKIISPLTTKTSVLLLTAFEGRYPDTISTLEFGYIGIFFSRIFSQKNIDKLFELIQPTEGPNGLITDKIITSLYDNVQLPEIDNPSEEFRVVNPKWIKSSQSEVFMANKTCSTLYEK